MKENLIDHNFSKTYNEIFEKKEFTISWDTITSYVQIRYT